MKNNSKTPWVVAIIGASAGMIASFVQIIERIVFADKSVDKLSCDLNSVFSCSSVFNGWQSDFFGFPNSIMCLAFFAIMFGVALSGLTGSKINKYVRLSMHFFSVFFLFFGAWYLQQSAYVLGALCVFCIGCYGGVIALNWAWFRLNSDEIIKSESTRRKIFRNGADTFFWLVWTLVICAMLINKFIGV